MLRLIGLGLADGDVPRRAVDAVAAADTVFCEQYTNSIDHDLAALEAAADAAITVLDRAAVEDADRVFRSARERDTAFLVSGDPLMATTHQDLLHRARAADLATQVVHAPSILTAVGETGLSLYKFGRVTTLPEPYSGAVPDSPFAVIRDNRAQGLHTLLLLDVGIDAATAVQLLADRFPPETALLLCSRLGTADAAIRAGTLDGIDAAGLPDPVCAVVPGDLSDNERDRVDDWR